MLDITFGRTNCGNHRVIEDPRVFFKRYKEPWWFEDEFVKKFLLDIDKSTVLFEEALKDRWGRGISSSVISTGCKTLCCLYFNEDPDIYFNGSAMGDNCVKFLVEIAKIKDVHIFLEHFSDEYLKLARQGILYHNGELLDEDSFEDLFADWVDEWYRSSEEEDDDEDD